MPNFGTAARGCACRVPGQPDMARRIRKVPPALNMATARLLDFFPMNGDMTIVPQAEFRCANQLAALGLIELHPSTRRYGSGKLWYGRLTAAGHRMRLENSVA